jgi:hypothetical protein
MTFAWGVQDSSINIHLDSILGFEFTSNKEPFSIDILLEAFSAFSFEVIQSFMKDRYRRMFYIGCLGIAGMLMCFCSYFFEYKSSYKDKVKNIEDHNQFTHENLRLFSLSTEEDSTDFSQRMNKFDIQ